MTDSAGGWTGERRALAAALLAAARPHGLRLHLVGGSVRDLYLGRPLEDVDIAVEGPPAALPGFLDELRAAESRLEAEHPRFGTARLVAPDGTRVDLAVCRRETYAHPGALPTVTLGAAILEDLGRRDFTVHAMARELGLDGAPLEPLDPFGGRADLARKRLRLLHPGSLADDPTRALRGVRYAVRLGFQLDSGFEESLRLARKVGAFARVSGDRLRRGLEEVLLEPAIDSAIALLTALGLLDDLVPGWGRLAPRSLRSSGLEAWKTLLGPLPPDLRREVATRLSFSRKLCRMAGVPKP